MESPPGLGLRQSSGALAARGEGQRPKPDTRLLSEWRPSRPLREVLRLDKLGYVSPYFTVERVPDASVERLEAAWNEDWQRRVLASALARVKETANLKDCQMFELHVLWGLSPHEVARTLGASTARVYLAKHRLGPLVKQQVAELEQNGEVSSAD